MRILFPFFIVMPIVEMWLLIEVGQKIGALPTIGLVLLTAMIGLHLLKQQGLSTLLRANQKIEQGGLPAQEIMEGLILAVGGALLLTPGFFTDALGFCCLLPVSRKVLVKYMIAKGFMMASKQGAGFSSSFHSSTSFHAGSGANSSQGDIIDGEYTREGQVRIDKDSVK